MLHSKLTALKASSNVIAFQLPAITPHCTAIKPRMSFGAPQVHRLHLIACNHRARPRSDLRDYTQGECAHWCPTTHAYRIMHAMPLDLVLRLLCEDSAMCFGDHSFRSMTSGEDVTTAPPTPPALAPGRFQLLANSDDSRHQRGSAFPKPHCHPFAVISDLRPYHARQTAQKSGKPQARLGSLPLAHRHKSNLQYT